jgi:hypothetical protein
VARFRHDPQGFLDGVRPPVILDEIQNVPEVFNLVRSRIDRHPRRTGQWILTGSQEAGLMGNVTESMAATCDRLERAVGYARRGENVLGASSGACGSVVPCHRPRGPGSPMAEIRHGKAPVTELREGKKVKGCGQALAS